MGRVVVSDPTASTLLRKEEPHVLFRERPEERLWLVRQRQGELIHEAEEYRLSRAHPDDPAENLSIRLFNTIRVGLGQVFAVVRRRLSAHEEPCDDACPDGAPC
jgi:hypothetical protein